MDSSHLIMFFISISVIIYGSFRSLSIDKENRDQQLLTEKMNECGESKSFDDDEDNQQQTIQTIDSTQALFMPVFASISLLLMFFFFDSIQTAFLICTASQSLYSYNTILEYKKIKQVFISVLAVITFAFLLLPVCSFFFKSFCGSSRNIKYSV